MQNLREKTPSNLCHQNMEKNQRSHTVFGLLRKMLPHGYYLPICSCSMAIFNCSGIPIPGITARLLGSRSSREKQHLQLEHFPLRYHFIPWESHVLLPLVSWHISQVVGHLNSIPELHDIKRTANSVSKTHSKRSETVSVQESYT